MEKQFSFYDSEVSKFSMSGKTYWSEKPDLTLSAWKDDKLFESFHETFQLAKNRVDKIT
jgi:hypothetical protein